MPGFATFALARMPELAAWLARSEVRAWLDAQESFVVDGERRWLIWGDRLADEAEMKLDWARRHDLVDEARLAALQDEFNRQIPDIEVVDIADADNPDADDDQGRRQDE